MSQLDKTYRVVAQYPRHQILVSPWDTQYLTREDARDAWFQQVAVPPRALRWVIVTSTGQGWKIVPP